MIAPVFVDTNVFIYALDDADRKKQAAAREWRAELWKRRQGRISFQVLQEFYEGDAQMAERPARCAVRGARPAGLAACDVDGVMLKMPGKSRTAISFPSGTRSLWPRRSPLRAGTC